ncbi:Ctr copper transporter family protein [Besnoitia besnoiti]|uniref:Copper transport protein n=1 Tax=Besnoitia besnoiti TaxID=94643 RepID=A0A2A9MPP9_BESBE|nr:Ctr copper transporter family protein [Besnoitia besnoiti]PFH37812.1 Ctr copper transporter family protein [Besnoitia besnoiti]
MKAVSEQQRAPGRRGAVPASLSRLPFSRNRGEVFSVLRFASALNVFCLFLSLLASSPLPTPPAARSSGSRAASHSALPWSLSAPLLGAEASSGPPNFPSDEEGELSKLLAGLEALKTEGEVNGTAPADPPAKDAATAPATPDAAGDSQQEGKDCCKGKTVRDDSGSEGAVAAGGTGSKDSPSDAGVDAAARGRKRRRLQRALRRKEGCCGGEKGGEQSKGEEKEEGCCGAKNRAKVAAEAAGGGGCCGGGGKDASVAGAAGAKSMKAKACCTGEMQEEQGDAAGGHVAAKGHKSSCCGVMPMSFQNSYHTVILFHSWETLEKWQYVLSILACIVLGMISVILKVVRLRVEFVLVQRDRAAEDRAASEGAAKGSSLPSASVRHRLCMGFPIKQNAYRMVEAFIIYGYDYLLMLIVMTYNVGLFFAVTGGLALGFFFFGHMLRLKAEDGGHELDGEGGGHRRQGMSEDYRGDPCCCGT